MGSVCRKTGRMKRMIKPYIVVLIIGFLITMPVFIFEILRDEDNEDGKDE